MRDLFVDNDETQHYISRDKDEIELWINTQQSVRNKAIWALYSLGLRNHEIRPYRVKDKTLRSVKIGKYFYLGLEISQIDWDNKCLVNVKRKGGKRQARVALDDKTLSLLKSWLDYREKFNKEKEDTKLARFIFPLVSRSYFTQISDNHYNYLKKVLRHKKKRLKKKEAAMKPIPPALKKEIVTLEKIIKNGKITPHQLRHSWDYLATKLGMRDYLRRFHLNHTLKGMDQIYVAPHITYEDYRAEFDRAAPKFNIIL